MDPPSSRPSSKNTERSTADSRSVTLDSDHTAHQHTRVRTEKRAACPRASPQTTDHVHERRVPPPLHRPARLVRGVRGLHIPAPMLLLNSQLHAPFSTRPMSLAYFGTCLFWHLPFSTRVGATYTHPRTRRHGAPQSRNNLDGTGSGYSKGHSPVTALARHSARPSQRSPVTALDRPWLRIQAPVSSASLSRIRPHQAIQAPVSYATLGSH